MILEEIEGCGLEPQDQVTRDLRRIIGILQKTASEQKKEPPKQQTFLKPQEPAKPMKTQNQFKRTTKKWKAGPLAGSKQAPPKPPWFTEE